MYMTRNEDIATSMTIADECIYFSLPHDLLRAKSLILIRRVSQASYSSCFIGCPLFFSIPYSLPLPHPHYPSNYPSRTVIPIRKYVQKPCPCLPLPQRMHSTQPLDILWNL